MGNNPNISFDKFPEQCSGLNARVCVHFNYDYQNTIDGTIVRDDAEKPFITIIKLDNERHVLASECHYRLI